MVGFADQDEIMFDTLKRRRVMSLAMSVSPGHIYFVVDFHHGLWTSDEAFFHWNPGHHPSSFQSVEHNFILIGEAYYNGFKLVLTLFLTSFLTSFWQYFRCNFWRYFWHYFLALYLKLSLSLFLWLIFNTDYGCPIKHFFHWNPELLGLGRQFRQINCPCFH